MKTQTQTMLLQRFVIADDEDHLEVETNENHSGTGRTWYHSIALVP